MNSSASIPMEALRAEARALDGSDALSRYREEFSIPKGTTYLVGHSLGLLSRRAAQYEQECLGN